MNTNRPLLSLDIETKSPDPTCPEWALDPWRNEITMVAFFDGKTGRVIQSPNPLDTHEGYDIVTHGGKFDFKTLIAKGSLLTAEDHAHDTLNMAAAFPHKIPEKWLGNYEAQRSALNEKLGANIHRRAGKYSLKCLAPYFLGVDPFWEVADHADAEYAAKDAKYTYQLAELFLSELGEHRAFYDKLQSWARMLLRAEIKGVMLDYDKLSQHETLALKEELEARSKLKEEWHEYFKLYDDREISMLASKYNSMSDRAIEKLRDPNETKILMVKSRYSKLRLEAQAKLEPLNLSSPTQLKWLLKEAMGVDITTFDGEDESTGKAVLERLKSEGVRGLDAFISYRQANKLNTSFFPSYRENAVKGRLRTNYNVTGTRTGRLSSSNVNLQQVSKKIMDLLRAPDGRKLVYRDVSAIEPRLLAYETECPNLCKIFVDGSDFHSFNVRVMLGIEEDDKTIKAKYPKERDLIKEVGLSLLYGAGWKRVQESAARRGFRFNDYACKQMYYNVKNAYERIFEYKEHLEHKIRMGEVITNVLGRPLQYDDHYLHTTSLNTKIQSGASDLLLASVCKAEEIAKERGLSFEPLLFIHDSTGVECDEKDATAVYDLIGEAIASWDMTTIWGRIPLLSEGGIYVNLPSK